MKPISTVIQISAVYPTAPLDAILEGLRAEIEAHLKGYGFTEVSVKMSFAPAFLPKVVDTTEANAITPKTANYSRYATTAPRRPIRD